MEPSNFRGNTKFINRNNIPVKMVKRERYDEEWNEFTSQEEFGFENKKGPIESIPEPEYDEEEVLLSWYDSDLNLIIDENFTAASPLHQRGFSYLQAGARATYGFFSGKVCFEVKVLQCGKLSSRQGHLNTHLLRVGWSPRKSSLALGSDHKSYGYDSTGRISTIGEIEDYGKMFSTGDVVGAYMDAADDVVSISFTLNGEDMGMAYEVPQSVIQKEPLFPHVLTKNISYECNFGKEKPWFPLKDGYTFVANVDKVRRIAGPRRPKSQSECEVILMVGLPKSGKTSWVNEFREKHPGMYYVIDTNALVDRMELMDPEREALILQRTKVLGKLLGIAMDRRRNYILDQVNVTRIEQVWKLGFFRNHKRRIVSVVIPDDELQKRIKKLDDNDREWMFKLKAKFRLPMMACRQIAQVADSLEYVGLPLNAALPLVKKYNREAWRLGYKPFKNFRVPAQVFKEKNNPPQGDWMPAGMPNTREADFHGGGGWNSPPRDRGGDEWAPPPRNRSGEDWQSPSMQRNSGEWHSPSRQRMSGDWPPRSGSPRQWPPSESNRPGGVSGSPFKGKPDEGWPPGPRKRRHSESPPRRRPGTRWGPPVADQSPPRSRMEEWESRRGRSPGPRNSPPRRRPDSSTRYADHHSPPGIRSEELEPGRNMVCAQDVGDWRPHEGVRHMQGNPDHEDWIGMGPERQGRFPSRESRDRGGAYQDMQIEGNFPPERRRDDGMRPPHEADLGGRFSHREGRMGGRSLSPPVRMDVEFPIQEVRFNSQMLHSKERVGDSLHPREVRMDPEFLSHDQRMGGSFPRKDGGFPPQDVHFETERVVYEERGNMPPLHGRMGRDVSPHRRRENNFPPPERRMGGLSVRDRLGAKLDDVPPRGARPSRSLSPHERMIIVEMHPHDGRIPSDMAPFNSEMGGFSPRQGRIDEIPPHMGKMRDDRMAPIGRIGGDMYPHENRMSDTRSVRLIGNLSPRESRMGDMPPHESRMGRDFSPRAGRSRDRSLPRGSGRDGDYGPDGPGFRFPHHEEPGSNFAHHESRMGGDILPRERMSAEFSYHEERVGHGDLHRGREMGNIPRGGREIADIPHGGRMSSDRLSGGEVRGDIPSQRGRISGDMTSVGNRNSGSDLPRGGEFAPNMGRIDADLPPRGRAGSGDFLPRGGKIIGDLPPRDRIDRDHLPHRERIEDDGGRRGDLPPLEGRRGGDMPLPGGKSFGDAPLFGGRHDEFPSRGGRPGNDKPYHGRPDDNMPPDGRMFGADFTSHGGRIADDAPSGRRMGGDQSQEVGMLDDPREGRGSSSDHWNRLPADDDDPRNFEWMGAQEAELNERSVTNRPRNSGQLHPHGGPPGDWKPLEMLDRPSQPMQQQSHRLDNRDHENINRFHENKRVSPNRAPHNWTSPNRARRSGSPLSNRPRRQSLSPLRRSEIDQQGLRQNLEQPGGRHISPRRPMPGRQSPIGRNDRRSPEGRHLSHQLSPVRGGLGVGGGAGGGVGDNSWRPPGGRQSGDWQILERGNHGGERLPPNIDRGRHSPPRKQQRLETNLGDRPGRPFTEGLDGRDTQGPGFQPMGSFDQQLEPTGRDLRDRMSGQELHGPAFNPSGLSVSGGQFLGKEDPVKEPSISWQGLHGVPHQGWQTPGRGGSGSRWERGPEEEEELAPYEIPFNQADWDSNDPKAGIFSESGYPVESSLDPSDDRSKESSGNRNQEGREHPDSKGRGSVWQRVGGYVNDEKESRMMGPRGGYVNDEKGSNMRGPRGGYVNDEKGSNMRGPHGGGYVKEEKESSMREPRGSGYVKDEKESSTREPRGGGGYVKDEKESSMREPRGGGYVKDEKESRVRGPRGSGYAKDEKESSSRGSRGGYVKSEKESSTRGSRGGYAKDEKDSSVRGSRGSSRYTDHSSRSERSHRGAERGNKDRARELEGNRIRRGRDK